MTETETIFRYVVEAELRDQQRAAHAVAYAGAVAESVRRSQLAGSGVFTEKLIEVLAADRRAEYAANELGMLACLVAETWVLEQWETIAARAAVVELPTPLTVTEEQHRCAAIAVAAELRDLGEGVSRTAVITLAAVMAAARARWDLDGLGGIETASQQAVISDVLTADPVAEAAAAELGDTWQQIAGPIMIEHWDEIHERATETATLAAIESAA